MLPSECHSQFQKQRLNPNPKWTDKRLKRSIQTNNSLHYVDLHNEHLRFKE